MQIPLELKLPVKADLNDFVAENRQEITTAIRELIDSPDHNFLFLWGKQATGKTHLLSALCQLAENENLTSIYLPLNQFKEFSPEICEGLEAADIICLDDIDQICGDSHWEIAIFHLYNRVRDANKKLVISSSQSPVAVDINLADLKSRLAWGITLALKVPSDPEKKMILKQRARKLGMDLPDETGNYLLSHHSRTISSLLATLDSLERASLAAHRKLTVPFVKEYLNSIPTDKEY